MEDISKKQIIYQCRFGSERVVHLLEWVVHINWNGWSTSIGMGGPHQLEWVVHINWNGWSTSIGMGGPHRLESVVLFSWNIHASAMKDNIEDILLRFQLIKKDKLNNAALILFAKENVYLPQSRMKMARFKGKDKLGDFIDNLQVSGNVFKILNEADNFLRRHLPISSIFIPDQFKRIDQPALPVMAVRETLINALAHRDYADRSTDISLAIYDDRLELWNSGVLPKRLTIDDLKHSHESVLRNELIANTLYIRGYIEKWGTGTNKMIDLCKAEGIPEPTFIERTGELAVIFKFKEIIGAEKPGVMKKTQLTRRQQEILNILNAAETPLSSNEILKQLPILASIRTVQIELSVLKSSNLVKQIGKGKSILWRNS